MSETGRRPVEQADSRASRLRWLFGWAQLAIKWERFWLNLWPTTALLLLFTALVFFDVLPLLPFGFHWAVLLAFAGLFAYSLRRVFKASYDVSEDQVRHRIEQESGLSHRPLTALKDSPVVRSESLAVEDEASDALWRAHQKRVAEQLSRLKAPVPKPGLAARDRFALRSALAVLVIVSVFMGYGNPVERLQRALFPVAALAQSQAIEFDIWITPPAYTGMAPLFLDKPLEKALIPAGGQEVSVDQPAQSDPPALIDIPVASDILVQLSGADTEPVLRIGSRAVPVARVGATEDNQDFRLEDTLTAEDQAATVLTLAIGEQILAEWPVRVRADSPPKIALTEPPKRSRRASLELKFEATDDFAVKEIWAEISLSGDGRQTSPDNRIRFDLTANGFGTPKAKGRAEKDYSAHKWAGLPVEIRLFAKDTAGQIGESEPVEAVLPARTFNHPVARALVEIRKDLNRPTEDVVEQSRETLMGLMQRPHHFSHDTVVFLSMSVARARLRFAKSNEDFSSVQSILWETALRIEDGAFSIAERDLREIQERLAEAIQNNASPEEIDRLMKELQEALNKYMQALAEHMERQGLSEMPIDPNMRTMETMDLQDMVNQARELAKTGAMDAAKRMLSQLNRMLDSLKNGTPQRQRQNQEMAKMREMMNKLRELSQRQQKLMDETFRQSQNNQNNSQNRSPMPQRPGQSMRPGQMPNQNQGQQQGQQDAQSQQMQEAMRKQQDALRKELGRLMLQMDEMLGQIPKGLGEAERSMKGAGDSLGEGDASGAVPQQADALEKLRQGMESAAEQMAQRMQGQGMGIGMGIMPGGQRGGQRRGNNRDPFGRQNGEGQFGSVNDDDGIKVPSQSEIFRAREIMEELHRRSGESGRQKPERDYIDRLLRRF